MYFVILAIHCTQLSSHVKKNSVYVYGYVGVHMDMLVGLGNASFLMIHKFTEKRQEVDNGCVHGEEPGILWEEH